MDSLSISFIEYLLCPSISAKPYINLAKEIFIPNLNPKSTATKSQNPNVTPWKLCISFSLLTTYENNISKSTSSCDLALYIFRF